MTDKKLTDLPDLPFPDATDLLLVDDVSASVTKSITVANLAAAVAPSGVILADGSVSMAADLNLATNNLTNVGRVLVSAGDGINPAIDLDSNSAGLFVSGSSEFVVSVAASSVAAFTGTAFQPFGFGSRNLGTDTARWAVVFSGAGAAAAPALNLGSNCGVYRTGTETGVSANAAGVALFSSTSLRPVGTKTLGTVADPWSVLHADRIETGIESVVESGTTRTLTNADHNRLIVCDNVAGCTITVPTGLKARFTCAVFADTVGDVALAASGTTLKGPTSAATPYVILEDGGTLGIMQRATNSYAVSGALR